MNQQVKKKKAGFLATAREIIVLLLIVFLIRTFGFGLYQVPSGSMETTMLVGERFFADKFSYLFMSPKRGDIIAFNSPLFDYSENKIQRMFEEYVWGPQNVTKRIIGIPGDTVKGVVEEGKPIIYLNGKKLDEPYLNKYPLIALWTKDKQTIKNEVDLELEKLILERRIDPTRVNEARTLLEKERTTVRSYDPQIPYNEQPFYRINPESIVYEAGKPIVRLAQKAIEDGGRPVTKKGKSFWNGSDEFYIELGPNEYWVMGDNRRGSGDSRFFGPIEGRLIHGRILFRIWSVDSGENWWIVDLLMHPIDFWTRMRWSRFFQFMH